MRAFLASFVLVCGLAAPAQAVTLRDLIDLSKQGLTDNLLIALVEAEQSVFHLNAADVKALKDAGLSDRLVIHLLQTPALRPAAEMELHVVPVRLARREAAPAPQMIVVDRVETIVVPVYVPVPAHRRADDDRGERRKPAEPVYWGYGGKLRPDAWAGWTGRQKAAGKRQR